MLLEKYPFVEVRGPSGFTGLRVVVFNVWLLIEMEDRPRSTE
jgi:hypothetical protein